MSTHICNNKNVINKENYSNQELGIYYKRIASQYCSSNDLLLGVIKLGNAMKKYPLSLQEILDAGACPFRTARKILELIIEEGPALAREIIAEENRQRLFELKEPVVEPGVSSLKKSRELFEYWHKQHLRDKY